MSIAKKALYVVAQKIRRYIINTLGIVSPSEFAVKHFGFIAARDLAEIEEIINVVSKALDQPESATNDDKPN